MGRAGGHTNERTGDALQRPPGRTRGPAMSATLKTTGPPSSVREVSLTSPAPPLSLERRHWLAALAVLVVFFAPYQTLVQTVLTDDAVRKGLNIDDYDMIWQQVGYGVGILYGLFTAIWLSARIGARYTIVL